MARKNEPQDIGTDEGWSKAKMPLSATIEGWWERRIGDTLHATIIGVDESKYGEYFIAKLRAPVMVKSGDEDARPGKAGMTVAFSVTAAMRDVRNALSKGPVEVKIGPLTEGEGKAKFAFDVLFRPAF